MTHGKPGHQLLPSEHIPSQPSLISPPSASALTQDVTKQSQGKWLEMKKDASWLGTQAMPAKEEEEISEPWQDIYLTC